MAILVLGILWYQSSQYQNPSTKPSQVSPHVDVQYKAIGWFYSSWIAGTANSTYFLIDVTITNGYTKPVLCQAWSASGGFSLTTNGVTYNVWGLGTIPAGLYNGTTTKPGNVIPTNFASEFSSLPDVSLANKAQASGAIAFQLPAEPQTFSLNYSTDFDDYSWPVPEVRITQKG